MRTELAPQCVASSMSEQGIIFLDEQNTRGPSQRFLRQTTVVEGSYAYKRLGKKTLHKNGLKTRDLQYGRDIDVLKFSMNVFDLSVYVSFG